MGEPVARKDILAWVNKLFRSIPAGSPEELEKTEVKTTALVVNGHGP